MLSSKQGMWGDLEISGGVGGSIQISSKGMRHPGYLAYLIDLQLQNSSAVTNPPSPLPPALHNIIFLIRHVRPHLPMGFFLYDLGQSVFCMARFCIQIHPAVQPPPLPRRIAAVKQRIRPSEALTTRAAKLIPP